MRQAAKGALTATGARPGPRRPETLATVAGHDLVADPSGALWWEAPRTLVVSDLHLEKGSAHAARGIFLPPYDTAATLSALRAVMARYRPARVILLGDSFHDGGGPDRMATDDRQGLLALQRGADWVWIAGNHDPDLSGAGFAGLHATQFVEAGLSFVHIPSQAAAAGEIAGHLHPVARIAGRGRSVRRRAFVGDGTRLVLPAFGAFTGGLNVLDPAIRSLFGRTFSVLAVGDEAVYPVGRASCLPD
ncbi:ligase-associated DNA damage response endonuclease PdeM [Phreatobacter sp.]|uniref:ligase-associated DNA damage response endonuclease PdeM n=1 Tax=Phreatobacter sp. TaxID=1966341 RepID=UPI003F71325D